MSSCIIDLIYVQILIPYIQVSVIMCLLVGHVHDKVFAEMTILFILCRLCRSLDSTFITR